MIEDDFILKWWPIRSHQGNDYQGRLFCRLERRGWIGYCITGESSHERQALYYWCKTILGKGNHVLTRMEYCTQWHNLIGYYESPNRCLWMPLDHRDAFEAFMADFPVRDQTFRVNRLATVQTSMAKALLRGVNYRLVEPVPGVSSPSIVSVQEFDRLDHFKVLLALSQ